METSGIYSGVSTKSSRFIVEDRSTRVPPRRLMFIITRRTIRHSFKPERIDKVGITDIAMGRLLPFTPQPQPLPDVFYGLPTLDLLLPHPPPIQKLARLSAHLSEVLPATHSKHAGVSSNGNKPQAPKTTVFAYRDDLCSNLSPAGNKLRKLVYVIPHAFAQSDAPVTHLVTEGGVQSNCCRQTAMVAARLGLKCVAVLSDAVKHKPDEELYATTGNVQLEKLLGTEVRQLDSSGASGSEAKQTQAIVDEINAKKGQRAFFVPTGASLTPLGGMGYAHWVFELLQQEAQMRHDGKLGGSGRFDVIVVACASGSTLAGMVAGMRLAEKTGWADASARRRIVGVETFAKPVADQHELVLRIARSTATLLGMKESDITPDDVDIDDRWAAGAYGLCDKRTQRTLKTLARTEALFLDPVYTGKAMTAVLEGVSSREMVGNVLFLHTGGQAALSAYPGVESDDWPMH
ncbi:hypothetical protein FH972_023686 [Carpinus fangiana]|uniref:Tryptophan synthase beta chain-like PALP domain-containing protein n=1 Tax=Carpinus fangiana TaxID=176857 RepID=A0A5N6KWE6_9ROSI|nr:hypothetical protein FH972_023686 [Carpinus fangiana]